MSVVRILTASKDDTERPVIKKNLEERLKASSDALSELTIKHHKELRLVMQGFNSISDNLQTSLSKLGRAKQRLKDCREKLTSRLDELRRLSEESKKNEKILVLLDQVDNLSRVPSNVSALLNNQEYLEASKLLVEKQKHIDDNFESFDCLKELRAELDTKREEIYKILREKLFSNDESKRNEIVESLKLIDKTPEELELEDPKEKLEDAPTVKPSLFRFSLSSHAICFNEHYKEQIEVAKTILSK